MWKHIIKISYKPTIYFNTRQIFFLHAQTYAKYQNRKILYVDSRVKSFLS